MVIMIGKDGQQRVSANINGETFFVNDALRSPFGIGSDGQQKIDGLNQEKRIKVKQLI